MEYLSKLNQSQHAAVICGEGPILILAGAGSGKTRVLTHRIAHLIFQHRVHPSEIFAVTFTNKAAAEMRERVVKLLESNLPPANWERADWGRELWISTFHSACVRILRSDIHHLGFDRSFTIYDDSDQLSVIKASMKDLNVSDSSYSPKAIQSRINKVKNDGMDHLSYRPSFGGPFEDAFMRVFTRYAEVLQQSNALDFADLILTTVNLFQQCPDVLAAYQRRFPYLLIDEYQDTNRCQYLFMKLLAGSRGNICAVGDEDQSIYKWRGADISNILNFEKDYPNCQIFKLEENYRSTKNIIEAASHVIANNTERREKKLWTQNPEGEKIDITECYDEHDEVTKVTAEIQKAQLEGEPINEMAIFYRTNAQSRLLEDMMRAKGINYQIFGGLKFYERLEIKDSIAYLKLLSNQKDDVSFRRIINVPARGIGQVSLDKLVNYAKDLQLPLYYVLYNAFGPQPTVQLDLGRAQKKFQDFFNLIESLRAAKASLLPSDLLNMVLEESGYRQSLIDENTVESQSRLENLAELRQGIVEHELRKSGEDPKANLTLEGFLEEIALVSSADKADPDAPALKMMTIHMAKGLEFDRVLIVGLEEELFPNIRPWEAEDPADLEEERRLFYVGMTRARKHLSLFHAKNRTIFGNSTFRVMSRFVEEIPERYVQLQKADFFSRRRPYLDKPGLPFGRTRKFDDGFESQVSQTTQDFDDFSQDMQEFEEEGRGGYRIGSKVEHPTFGIGVIRQTIGKDKLIVEFRGRGLKKISTRFSQLKNL